MYLVTITHEAARGSAQGRAPRGGRTPGPCARRSTLGWTDRALLRPAQVGAASRPQHGLLWASTASVAGEDAKEAFSLYGASLLWRSTRADRNFSVSKK